MFELLRGKTWEKLYVQALNAKKERKVFNALIEVKETNLMKLYFRKRIPNKRPMLFVS
jgi:hypothetical protein